MAELASGAVSSLLGVIRNEAQLLSGVQGDVQFIREEMESMNSFLMHLARTAARGAEHDEQVRTWMGQVRQLAHDGNNCLDIYLYRGNPDIHLPKERLLRCLLWAPWFLRKLVAQRRAAIQLHELKERARDVGKRRLRYGVEIPTAAKPAQPLLEAGAGRTAAAAAKDSSAQEAAAFTAEAGGGGEEDDEDGGAVGLPLPASDVTRLLGVHDVGDYFNRKLEDWIKDLEGGSSSSNAAESMIPSITIVAPDNTEEGGRALAHGALDVAKTVSFHTVMIDIPGVHYNTDHDEPLGSEEILCYMWRELEFEHANSTPSSSSQQQQGEGKKQYIHWRERKIKWRIYKEKRKAIREIVHTIQHKMKVGDKIKNIESDLYNVTTDKLELLDPRKVEVERLDESQLANQSLAVLLLHLNRSAATMAIEQYQKGKKKKKKTRTTSAASSCNRIIKETSKKLKQLMEEEEEEADTKEVMPSIRLHQDRYANILQEVFLQDQEQYTTTASTSALREDQIEAKIHEAKREILLEMEKMMEAKIGKKQDPISQDEIKIEKIPLDEIARVKEKIKDIQHKIEALTKIRGIMDKIYYYLKDSRRILLVLYIDRDYALSWEEVRNALRLLGHVAGAVIVTTTSDTQRAKEYCSPPLEPMEYSLVGLYHDIVLELRRKLDQRDEEGDSYIDSHVFRGILDECGSYEFSMKIFAHALYSNPKMSIEELQKLHKTMKQVAPESFGKVAKKMIKFSYNDLPKEYKTCLLYLAIFPRGYKIRRSTLIGRWVVEGLITTEDWRWHNSVHEAKKCFEVLVDRWLIYPIDIGATGKVTSCTVGDLVYEFITKIAKKQRILEARLSRHLAHHFSFSNDLHLRRSDKIDDFLRRLYESSHLSVLKVLDLEGCHCFKDKQRYMKVICSKILLLKYLSLRRTDVASLPSEINNLHDLEVLDIRDTQLSSHATRHVRLLKLKRLLAGQTDPTPSNTGSSMAVYRKEIRSSVQIPAKIEKMLDMEVLSNVKGTNHQDLKDIGKLWQLRKLGIAIDDKDSHLKYFLQTISDLYECLQSLSITLPTASGLHEFLQSLSTTLPTTVNKDTPSSGDLPSFITKKHKKHPKHLTNLRISGTTERGRLLPFLVKEDGELAKVTLRNTWLWQKDLDYLANLRKLHYLKLRCIAYREGNLTFKEGEFPNLKYILVERSNITDISFDGGAPELEKIVLPFTGLKLNGVLNLHKLEEVELNNNTSSATTTNNSSDSSRRSNNLLSIFKDATQVAKMTLHGTLLKQDDLRDFAKNTKIRCLTLSDKSYDESRLTFNKDEFPNLNILVLNCTNITNVNFESGSAPKINKIVWSFKKMESLSGINNLQRLRELEFNGDLILPMVKEEIKKHKNKPYILHNRRENQEQTMENTNEEKKSGARYLCWKHEN